MKNLHPSHFCAAHTVMQAGGLHSTEMRSCFFDEFIGSADS